MAVELSEVRGLEYIESDRKRSGEADLRELDCGEKGVITNTPSDPFLSSLGFRAGKTVAVIAREVFNGPLICAVDGRNIAIGRDIAGKIRVNCN